MKVGERVEHVSLGQGTVKSVTENNLIVIVDFGKFEVVFNQKDQESLRVL